MSMYHRDPTGYRPERDAIVCDGCNHSVEKVCAIKLGRAGLGQALCKECIEDIMKQITSLRIQGFI